ncbi:MAG: hypothetical protein E7365_07015 [Clostridiales bacterium]|nr:hypothetical protein [Clostridiales bacterium]
MSKIPIIVEDNFKQTIWYNQMLKIFSKKNVQPILKSSIKTLKKDSVILIIGVSNIFINECIQLCKTNSIRCIVVGANLTETNSFVSYVTINRKATTSNIVSYFKQLNAKRIALLGINTGSIVDYEKKQGFTDSVNTLYGYNPEEDIYNYTTSAQETINNLLKRIDKYDAVICANDYFAIKLILSAKKIGINIPDDLMIAGYGNSSIGKLFKPSITSASFDYKKTALHAIKLFYFLTQNPEISNCNICIDCNVIPRETTNFFTPNTTVSFDLGIVEHDSQSIINDIPLKQILGLDEILNSTDKINSQILLGIHQNLTLSEISEKLYISATALRYRMKKIYQLTNTHSKQELYQLLINIFDRTGDIIGTDNNYQQPNINA